MLEIKTNQGYRSFETVTRTEAGSGLRIEFGDDFIECTPNHKLWDPRGYIRADTIQTNEKIDGKTVTSINYTPGGYFYDVFNVDGHHYSPNNIEVSNCAYLNPLKFEEFKDGILP